MKTLMHRKALAIAAAVMLGLATTGGAALARGGGGLGGGGGGGHIGGFGGGLGVAHVGGLSGAHIGGFAGPHVGGFGSAHIGGLGVHPMPGIAMGHGLDEHGLGHTHVSHELRDHHFRGLYGASPLYDGTDCPWPQYLTIESCPVGSDID
jgi:hypothetical protein